MTAKIIRERLIAALNLKGPQKLCAFQSILEDLRRLEAHAAADWNFSLEEITMAQSMVPDVRAGISKMEAGKRRSLSYRERKAKEKALNAA